MGTTPSSAGERRGFLTSLLSTASDKVREFIRAENVFAPGANLAARFQDHAKQFSDSIRSELPDFLGDEYGDKLEKLLAETVGYSLPNFLNDSIFRNEVCDTLFDDVIPTATDTLIENTQTLVQNAYFEVLSDLKEQVQFPKVVPDIHKVVVKQLERATDHVKHVTKWIILAEQRQVYTSNPSYLENRRQVKHVADDNVPTSKQSTGRKGPLRVCHFSSGDAMHSSSFGKNSEERNFPTFDGPVKSASPNGGHLTEGSLRVKFAFIQRWNTRFQDGKTSRNAMELQISIL